MKRFAYKYENGEYEKINVWDVYRGEKNDPHRWENMRYFSTHKKIENRKEMIYVRRKPNYYFKYKSLNDIKSHEGRDTTLTHEIVQEIISELKEITFVRNDRSNKVYKIYVSDWEVEQEIKTPNKDYFVDILFKFEKSEPESLLLQWNGTVAVEIHVTNEVKATKVKDLLDVGIPILEHTVSKKLYIDDSREITEADIIEKKQLLTKYYKEAIYVSLKAEYSSKEYLTLMEIQELKEQVVLLEKQNTQKSNEIQQYKLYINNMKNELDNLSIKLGDKNRELAVVRTENEQLKKSYWYKLSKIFKR